jgi:two-component system response regulator FlrC
VNPLNAYAKQKLENYSWPGNVRELQNVIHRAIIISNGQTIDADHIVYDELESHMHSTSTSLNESMIQQENDHIIRVLEEAKGNREACAQKLGVSTRTLRNKLARMKKMGIKISGREE